MLNGYNINDDVDERSLLEVINKLHQTMTNNAKHRNYIDGKINGNIQLADHMQLVFYPRLVIDLRWIPIRVIEGNVWCLVVLFHVISFRNLNVDILFG
jgi:hypothetical protein